MPVHRQPLLDARRLRCTMWEHRWWTLTVLLLTAMRASAKAQTCSTVQNATCTPGATCDAKTQGGTTTITCSCPTGFIGDGKVLGTGCSRKRRSAGQQQPARWGNNLIVNDAVRLGALTFVSTKSSPCPRLWFAAGLRSRQRLCPEQSVPQWRNVRQHQWHIHLHLSVWIRGPCKGQQVQR
jgi:hypothetical protein